MLPPTSVDDKLVTCHSAGHPCGASALRVLRVLESRQAEIDGGQVIVFAEDESHLLWGDTTGYVWGQRNERIEVPIQNIKERQTYYGALDLYNKEFFLAPSDKGNGENTVMFIERLQALNPDKKLMIRHYRKLIKYDILFGLESRERRRHDFKLRWSQRETRYLAIDDEFKS